MLMLFSLYCDMCDVFIEAQGGLQAIDVLASLLLGMIFGAITFYFISSSLISEKYVT